MPSYECQRRTPLKSPNDDVIEHLEILKNYRYLTGDARGSLSYAKAIASIRACPQKIESVKEASELPSIGPKITAMIKEFLESGAIQEAVQIKKDSEYITLTELSTVYGIGPSTAQKLMKQEITSLEILKQAVNLDPGLLKRDQLLGLQYVSDFSTP